MQLCNWCGLKRTSKLAGMDKRKILVFDTETTGLHPSTDEILQITILDGGGATLFDSYIRPKHRKTWKSAEKINHISPEMVKDAPLFSDVLSQIQDLFDGAEVVVGYNVVRFDIGFVEKQGVVVHGKVFDVM